VSTELVAVESPVGSGSGAWAPNEARLLFIPGVEYPEDGVYVHDPETGSLLKWGAGRVFHQLASAGDELLLVEFLRAAGGYSQCVVVAPIDAIIEEGVPVTYAPQARMNDCDSSDLPP
jgi:hypothetical protein